MKRSTLIASALLALAAGAAQASAVPLSQASVYGGKLGQTAQQFKDAVAAYGNAHNYTCTLDSYYGESTYDATKTVATVTMSCNKPGEYESIGVFGVFSPKTHKTVAVIEGDNVRGSNAVKQPFTAHAFRKALVARYGKPTQEFPNYIYTGSRGFFWAEQGGKDTYTSCLTGNARTSDIAHFSLNDVMQKTVTRACGAVMIAYAVNPNSTGVLQPTDYVGAYTIGLFDSNAIVHGMTWMNAYIKHQKAIAAAKAEAARKAANNANVSAF